MLQQSANAMSCPQIFLNLVLLVTTSGLVSRLFFTQQYIKTNYYKIFIKSNTAIVQKLYNQYRANCFYRKIFFSNLKQKFLDIKNGQSFKLVQKNSLGLLIIEFQTKIYKLLQNLTTITAGLYWYQYKQIYIWKRIILIDKTLTVSYSFNAKNWDKFIEQFGTHFLYEVILRGRAIQQIIYSSKSVSQIESLNIDINVAAKAAFTQYYAGASFDYHKYQSQIRYAQSLSNNINQIQIGGQPPKSGKILDWQEKVINDLMPINYKILPLSDLFDFNPNKTMNQTLVKSQFLAALDDYCIINIQSNFIKIENQQYCTQTKQFNIQKAKQLISQMNAKKLIILISRVKDIGSLQKQLKQMPNLFDNNFNTKNIALPKKGQNLAEILQLLKKWQIQKSKIRLIY